MWLRVLGSAAGGGSPQWNCGCAVCAAVRSGAAPVRTQSSVAVSADRRQWFLINASPDVRAQIEAFPGLRPGRDQALPVLLTDAELDHALGLLLLREAGGIRLYATAAVHKSLSDGSGILRTLAAYCPVEWRAVVPGVDLGLDGLPCRAFDVPTSKRDRFGLEPGAGRVVGYRLTGHSGRTLVYLPGLPALTPAVRAEIEGCDCLLVDGTCWRDDELGPGRRTAHQMGHLPVDRSLEQLRALGIGRVVFVHMNNTNPILLPGTPERRLVEDSGMEVAMDGLEVEV